MRTIFSKENEGATDFCTEFAQNSSRSPDKRVRFFVTIRHRSSAAKIYAPSKNFAYYRLSYATAGKRRMQTFATYPEARQAAERVVKELANGSQAAALSASQSRDALAVFEKLNTFYQSTGRRVSLLAAVSEFVEIERAVTWQSCGGLSAHRSQRPAQRHRRSPHRIFARRSTPHQSRRRPAGATLREIRLQPRTATAKIRRHIYWHRRQRIEPGTPRQVSQHTGRTENQFPQRPQSRLRQEPEPLPRDDPAIPALGRPQRLSRADAPAV